MILAADEATAEKEEEAMEDIALEHFGLRDFTAKLQEEEEKEEKELGALFVTKRRRWSNRQWKIRRARNPVRGVG